MDPCLVPAMSEPRDRRATTIRTAVATDAEGIARTFLESAEHHAGLDPERYSLPAIETVSARYREMRQLRAAEKWGSRHGAAFASLEYHVTNTRVIAFYRRSGYSVASITSIKRL
jgi:hypothetical protein